MAIKPKISGITYGVPRSLDEEYDDPMSPRYGKRVHRLGLEAGVDPDTMLGLFRSDLPFQAAKQRLIDAFNEARRSETVPGGYNSAMRRMGPAFISFISQASELKDFELSFVQPEVQAMTDFFAIRTNTQPDEAKAFIDRFIYRALNEKPANMSRRIQEIHLGLTADAMSSSMVGEMTDALQQRQSEQDMLREQGYQLEQLRKQNFAELRPKIEEFRQRRRDRFGGGS